jgi:hypothetical protein
VSSLRSVLSRVVLASGMLAVGAAIAFRGGHSDAADGPLVRDDFATADRLVTNELASARGHRGVPTSDVWRVTSGSLFVRGGRGWSGKPDRVRPDARSRRSTNSAVFRAVTRRRDLGDVDVEMSFEVVRFLADDAHTWDGFHVFLRYNSPADLYSVSLARRDGLVIIKRKTPGGVSNGGTYTELARAASPVALAGTHHAHLRVVDEPGGTAITVWIDGINVLSAHDRAAAGAITSSGAIGVRGDNCEFYIDDVLVTSTSSRRQT